LIWATLLQFIEKIISASKECSLTNYVLQSPMTCSWPFFDLLNCSLFCFANIEA